MKKIVIGIMIIFVGILGFILYKDFSSDSYITSEEAKEIAINDVSNKDGEYKFNTIEYKKTNDTYIYTLEFSDKMNKYTYKINAKTKKIISSKKELLTNSNMYMNEEDILEKVFNNANLNKNECNLLVHEVNIEDGLAIYTTIFYNNNIKYEYKTNAFTGAIITISKLNENAI